MSLYKGLAYAYRKLWMPLDSAYYYDSKVLEAKTEYDEIVSSIYYHHQLDQNEWLKTLKNRIISQEKQSRKVAEENTKLAVNSTKKALEFAEIIRKEKGITDSLNEKINQKNRALLVIRDSLNIANNEKAKTIGNNYILIVILALSLGGLAIVLWLLSKRKNEIIKFKELESSIKSLQSHDIKESILLFPEKIKNMIPSSIGRDFIVKSALNIGKLVVNVIDVTTGTFNKSDSRTYTTINSEIKLAQAQAEIFNELLYNSSANIHIINEIADEYLLHDVKLPFSFLSNFINNAVKSGISGDSKSITIIISARKITNGYLVRIEDDGCGIKETMKLVNESSRGIELASSSIRIHNKVHKDHIIKFSKKSSIWDKRDKQMGHGTVVEFAILNRR